MSDQCDCHKHRESWLTGIERAGLQDIVDKFAVLGPDDQPMFSVELDTSFTARISVLSWAEVIRQVDHDVVGEVGE